VRKAATRIWGIKKKGLAPRNTRRGPLVSGVKARRPAIKAHRETLVDREARETNRK